MANPKNTTRAFLSADVPSERDARKLAQRLANKLVKSSKANGATVVVTDEHGNKVCEVDVPAEH